MEEEEVEKVPWFVRLRIPPETVRQRLLESPNHEWSPISRKEWNAFLARKRTGQLKIHRGANTVLPCPGCGRFLRLFHITTKREVLEEAEESSKVHHLVSGYVCWFPCNRTHFQGDIRAQKSEVRKE